MRASKQIETQSSQAEAGSLHRFGCSVRAALLCALLVVATAAGSASAAPSEWTPEQNTGIALSLGALVGV